MPIHRRCAASGCSLVEVLIATTIAILAVASVAQLFALSTRATANARAMSFASMLAAQKIEQLRGLMWAFDTLGLPITDTTTDTSLMPPTIGGTGLRVSPAGALTTNTAGYVDYLDERGRSLGGGATVPRGAVYVRRWSIEAMPSKPNDTLMIQVVVTALGTSVSRAAVHEPWGARIATVRTRKPS